MYNYSLCDTNCDVKKGKTLSLVIGGSIPIYKNVDTSPLLQVSHTLGVPEECLRICISEPHSGKRARLWHCHLGVDNLHLMMLLLPLLLAEV
mmetsp:Transcript_16322/g.24878  ORF Transcript_16322/g.24878 Transcript_16322/m.24878 type:complete len:92 (-) Transcript_16322:1208-1483(-)